MRPGQRCGLVVLSAVAAGCSLPIIYIDDGSPTNGDAADASIDALFHDVSVGDVPPGDALDAIDATDSGDADAGPNLPAPRPEWPLSTSRLMCRRPPIRWQLGSGTDGALIDICTDRACTTIEQSIPVSGSSARNSDYPTPITPGVRFWRLHGRSGTVVGAPTSVVWEMTVRDVSTVSAICGAWGAATDVNGDGLADVLVGDPTAATGAGRAYIYLGGPVNTLPTTPSSVLTVAGSTGFGTSIESVGDINGDGFGDVAVSTSPTGASPVVYLYRGSASGLAATPSGMVNFAEPNFGTIEPLGDINGDGYADVMFAAPGNGTTAGAAHFFIGSAQGLVGIGTLEAPLPAVNDQFGHSAAAVGDIDGDGFDDFAIAADGTAGNDGVAYFYRGTAPLSTLSAPQVLSIAGNGRSVFVDAAGDVNQDGIGDLLFGTPLAGTGAPAPGAAYLYAGIHTTTGSNFQSPVMLTLPNDGVNFGRTVRGVGDIDADGDDDVVVGAVPGGSTMTSGHFYLYRGAMPFVSIAHSAELTSLTAGAGYGQFVSGPGDVNRDINQDIVTLDPNGGAGGTGVIYVLHGATGGAGVMFPAQTIPYPTR